MTLGRITVAAPCALALALLAGCGTPGAPQPPSLNLPRPVGDLSAIRHGDKVTLTWTPPRDTTDKQRIRRAGVTRICRISSTIAAAPSPNPSRCTSVGEVAPDTSGAASASIQQEGQKSEPIIFTDTLLAELQRQNPAGQAVYNVEALNPLGRSAGLSNAASVPLAPTLPPPERVAARVTVQGVEISATGTDRMQRPEGMSIEFHLYRRTEGSADEVQLEMLASYAESGAFYSRTFVDRTAEWEKTYTYRVAAVTTVSSAGMKIAEVQGEFSQPVTVLVHDVFPPATPGGLQAVFTEVSGQRFIDLTWTPNSEADLAGYNVYRREQSGGAETKLNTELLKSPSFRDTNVVPGHQYQYSVSAVDLRGNQSARSPEAGETVPGQP